MYCSIGSIYNAMYHPPGRMEVEMWAKENYPEVWEGLIKIGRSTPNEIGMANFKINLMQRA
jgi:hypothetical protein